MKCDLHGSEHGHTSGNDFCCRDCGAYWTARRACHCTVCHQTFAGETLYSRHQEVTRGTATCISGSTFRRWKWRRDERGIWTTGQEDE